MKEIEFKININIFKLLILKLLAVQTRLKKSLKIFNNNFKKVANNITIFK